MKGPTRKGIKEEAKSSVPSDDASSKVTPAGRSDTAPLTEKEIRKLSVWGAVALAARCAMRLQPLIRPNLLADETEEADAEAILDLDAAVTLAAFVSCEQRTELPTEYIATARVIASGLALKYGVAAKEAFARSAAVALAAKRRHSDATLAVEARNARAEASAAEAAMNAVEAVSAAVSAAAVACENETIDAVSRSVIIVTGSVAVARTAARADYNFLISEEVNTRGKIQSWVFSRSLWPTGEPSEWERVLREWRAGIESLSPLFPQVMDILKRHENLCRGQGIDWLGAKARADQWVKERGMSIREEGDSSNERDSLPDDSANQNSTRDTDPIPSAMSDLPSGTDLLNRTALVEALAGMFAAEEQGTPFTMALLGEWGAGKSSVIEQVIKSLRAQPQEAEPDQQRMREFRIAKFNAWEYEHTDNIRAALTQEIIKGLIDGVSWLQKQWLKVRFACKEQPWPVVKGVFSLLTAACATISVSWPIVGETWPTGAKSLLGGGLGVVFLVFARQVWKGLKPILEHPVSAELVSYMKLPDYGEHLGLVPVMKSHLSVLCDFLGVRENSNTRLVVFIDDLDRCSSECIVQTLDAARLIMEIPNTIVVFAIDDRIALSAVAEHYKGVADESRDKYEIARDYLCKIVQVCVKLPKAEADGFIRNALFAGAQPGMEGHEGAVSGAESGGETDGEAVPMQVSPKLQRAKLAQRRVAPSESADWMETSLSSMSTSALEMGPLPDSVAVYRRRIQASMPDTIEERDRFLKWAAAFDFRNPRLLVRLRNSYRLVKALDGRFPPERMMVMLFWLEFLWNLRSKERDAWEKALQNESEAQDGTAGHKVPLLEIRKALFGGEGVYDEELYGRQKEYASLFVLPHGPVKAGPVVDEE